MRPDDIALLEQVGPPTLAPDGSALVASVTHPDLDADATVGQLWRIALPGGTPERLTRGVRDTAPRYSPGGAAIAFLRAAAGAPPQLHVVAAAGGEPIVLTDAPLGVTSFAWSPPGDRIAFIARDPEPGRYGTVDGLPADAEPPRRFTTLKYRENGVGVTVDRPARLWILDLPDLAAPPPSAPAPRVGADAAAPPRTLPEARRLTEGTADLAAPAFTADGGAVLVLGSLHATADDDLVCDVWRVPAGGGAPERVTDGTASIESFAVDGDRIWTVGTELGGTGLDFVGRGGALERWQDGVPQRITDPAELDLGDGPRPAPDGDGGVLVVRRRRGAADLLRIDGAGGVRVLTDGVDVTGLDAAAGRIAVAVTTPRSAGELALVDDAGLSVLTDFAAPLADRIAPPRELEVPASDGATVHGWLTTPDGDGPFPVLLMIHGGPFAQYGAHLFDETQVLVDAGYAVVQCNPRGSAGYGEAHARAIRHRMGTVDRTDVLDFLEGAIAAEPRLDGGRVGIMGGSYGGYLTAWTIAHDDRFAAAVVERGFLDPEGFVGTSDIGSFFGDEYLGRDPDGIRAQSPQAVVDRVRTPVLVIHSEDDLRCPLPQGERYYAALRRRGTPAELLVFPGEDHELSRAGRPRHRVQRFDAILEWWRRHLPVSA